MKKVVLLLSLVLTLTMSVIVVKAQNYSQFGMQYYSKGYLIHPSLLGEETSYSIGAGVYSVNWDVEGQPFVGLIVGAIPLNESLNFGINLNAEKKGAFTTFRYLASLSYKMKLSEEDFLYFGASVGLFSTKLGITKGTNIALDPVLSTFNTDHKSTFDGDLGVTYKGKDLKVSLTLSNLKQFISDLPQPDQNGLLNASLQYDYVIDYVKSLKVSPIVHFRMFQDQDDQLDVGAAFSALDRIGFMTVYQTASKSFVSGIFLKQRHVDIYGGYHFWTGEANNDLGSGFELFVNLKLGNGTSNVGK